PSRWMEKLKQEKWNKSKRQLKLDQNAKHKPLQGSHVADSKGKAPGAKSDNPNPKTDSKKAAAGSRLDRASSKEESPLAEVEDLDHRLNQWEQSEGTERLLEDREGNKYGDAQLSIRSFLEACIFNEDVERAQRCLMDYHRNLSRRKQLSINTYNIMMHIWAKKGSLGHIGRLFVLVEEAGLKPNLDSYTAALECMGRSPHCSSRVISRCLQQLEEDGFFVEDLFKQCVFREDEREMVLKAVQTIHPDFLPHVDAEMKICSSPLVHDFYTERESAVYPKLDFSLAELGERFSRQLAMEQAGSVTIESVEASKPLTEHMIQMRELLAQLRSHWHQSLLQAFRESKMHLGSSGRKSWRMNLYPYLCLLEDKEYVDIMLQDGSCNGLQHYAALGRDVIGATSVNLMPCEVPQDVYSGVAQQVEEFRARDAEKGLKVAQVLEGFINRKVVKQTVMTVVYGVTRYGGRLQIEKRLKEIEEFPKDWLTESARLIAKSGSSVEWVTPLGLPIVQPYHRTKNTIVSTLQAQAALSLGGEGRPDTVKQKNAFPPNFIHSLDSTHMMLTALYCYSAGLTFVSVHDCFWTHAVTVDVMNKVCREQFVALHSQPILQNLSNFLLDKYGACLP
ncbi:UNVERIFIED_CONTAM: hypothetical protein FKN15_039259, partial [Acipenser sinensis]